MKRLLIIFLFIATQFAFANEQDRFEQANNAYAEQQYDSALEIYSQLIEDGWQSAAINFNTANCYYRLNSIGKAILYYEKAKALSPDDRDILANLKLAEAQKIDKFEVVPTPAFTRIFRSILSLFSNAMWLTIGLILVFLSATALTLFLVSQNKSTFRFGFYLTFGVLGLLFLFLGNLKVNHEENNQLGILTVANVYVKSEPENGEDLFIVHEGSKAKIEETFNGWIKARFPDGKTGWLQAESFEAI